MSDYSPEEVRGSSQLSWSDWDELPDRLDIEFPPEKFHLPSTGGSPGTRHDKHLEKDGSCSGPRDGNSDEVHFHLKESTVLGHHLNEFIKNFPQQCVDATLIDPQILGISTGSPQPRRTRVPRFNVFPHAISTTRDEVPATSSFQSTSIYESNSSNVFPNTANFYPTPSLSTANASQAALGQNTIHPENTLLPPAELASQQPLHQLSQIIKSDIPTQTEHFLSSIEMLSSQIRGSMMLLRRQHAMAFTIYYHYLGMEQSIRMRLWEEYLNSMRFHCINIRDGLIASLKTICWSFAEWMGVYRNDLPCGVVLRATSALRHANDLKAAIDHFVYPTLEDMVAKEAAREQPIDISGLALNQLLGDLAGGGVIPNH